MQGVWGRLVSGQRGEMVRIRQLVFGGLALLATSGAVPAAAAEVLPIFLPQDLPEQIPLVVVLQQETVVVGRDPGEDLSDQTMGRQALVGLLRDAIQRGGEDAFAQSASSFDAQAAEARLMASIRQNLTANPRFHLVSETPLRNADQAALQQAIAAIPGSHLLVAECAYNLSMRFQAVYSGCSLRLEQRGAAPGAVYANFVEAQVELANIARSVGGRREQWLAGSGSLLTEGIGHVLDRTGELLSQALLLNQPAVAAARAADPIRFVTAYVGMAGEHRGWIIAGGDNIVERFHPNSGGLSYRYGPAGRGVTVIEGCGLFYHWTIDNPPPPAAD